MTQDAKDLLARLDSATTAVGNRIDALVSASKTMNPEEKAAFSAIADHLQALATDPNNPVPPAPPETV